MRRRSAERAALVTDTLLLLHRYVANAADVATLCHATTVAVGARVVALAGEHAFADLPALRIRIRTGRNGYLSPLSLGIECGHKDRADEEKCDNERSGNSHVEIPSRGVCGDHSPDERSIQCAGSRLTLPRARSRAGSGDDLCLVISARQ